MLPLTLPIILLCYPYVTPMLPICYFMLPRCYPYVTNRPVSYYVTPLLPLFTTPMMLPNILTTTPTLLPMCHLPLRYTRCYPDVTPAYITDNNIRYLPLLF